MHVKHQYDLPTFAQQKLNKKISLYFEQLLQNFKVVLSNILKQTTIHFHATTEITSKMFVCSLLKLTMFMLNLS